MHIAPSKLHAPFVKLRRNRPIHQALLSLGDDVYLELIAPDPDQPAPETPRIFGLDDSLPDQTLYTMSLHPEYQRGADKEALKRGSTIESLAKVLQGCGENPGPVRDMSRIAPDGQTVWWRFTSPAASHGPVIK